MTPDGIAADTCRSGLVVDVKEDVCAGTPSRSPSWSAPSTTRLARIWDSRVRTGSSRCASAKRLPHPSQPGGIDGQRCPGQGRSRRFQTGVPAVAAAYERGVRGFSTIAGGAGRASRGDDRSSGVRRLRVQVGGDSYEPSRQTEQEMFHVEHEAVERVCRARRAQAGFAPRALVGNARNRGRSDARQRVHRFVLLSLPCLGS